MNFGFPDHGTIFTTAGLGGQVGPVSLTRAKGSSPDLAGLIERALKEV